MPKQLGIVKFKGTMGGMTFYKTQDGHLVKEKSSVSAEKIANDPAFQRTRENGAEFGAAGIAGKLLRDSIRTLMLNASDSRITSRITQIMTNELKLDVTNVRGKRTPATGLATAAGKALLKGLDFNINAILGSILFKPFAVNTTTGIITINALVPGIDIAFPSGATHVTITGAYGNINFVTGIVDVKLTNAVNLALNSVSGAVTLTPTAVPAGTGIKIFFLKMEFFQLLNTVQYPLKNGGYNTLAIIEVA